MATSVKRHTDKSSRRIAKLERELREAQTMISELRVSIIFLNALSEHPIERLAGGIVESTEAVAVGGGTVQAAPERDAVILQFRPRS